MRKILAVVAGVFLLLVAMPFVHHFVQWCGGNHYPGTEQQAGAASLLGTGKQIATAVRIYYLDHGEWPATLSEVTREGLLTTKQVCSYPKTDDLPDRRDLLKTHAFEDWIYVKPQGDSPPAPMVIAPRAIRVSMGYLLPKPQRIVVDQDTVAQSFEEEKIAPALRKLTGD